MGIKRRLRIEKERWRLKTLSAQTAKTKEVETFFIPSFAKFVTTVLQTQCIGADVGLLRHKQTHLWKYHKNNPLFRNNPLTFVMKKRAASGYRLSQFIPTTWIDHEPNRPRCGWLLRAENKLEQASQKQCLSRYLIKAAKEQSLPHERDCRLQISRNCESLWVLFMHKEFAGLFSATGW